MRCHFADKEEKESECRNTLRLWQRNLINSREIRDWGSEISRRQSTGCFLGFHARIKEFYVLFASAQSTWLFFWWKPPFHPFTLFSLCISKSWCLKECFANKLGWKLFLFRFVLIKNLINFLALESREMWSKKLVFSFTFAPINFAALISQFKFRLGGCCEIFSSSQGTPFGRIELKRND